MTKTSTMLLIALALCVSAAAQSKPEDDKGPVFAKTPSGIPLGPPLTSGAVEDNTYKNVSLGLQFTPPPGLKFSAPELKGKPGTLPVLVTVAALSEVNGGAAFYAEDLGYYPEDRRSTQAYVERVIRSQKKEGLNLVEANAEEQLGGVTFSRVDFRQTFNYEVVLVKACDAYAFVFIFGAPDLQSANTLIAHTTVKLDMKISGCGEPITSTPPNESRSSDTSKISAPDSSPSSTPQKLPICYYMPMPHQTKEAEEAKFHGAVRVEGIVTLKGDISNVRVINSPGLGMDDVILRTMKTWKCNPGVGPQGKPIPMLVPFELNFRLD